MVKKQLSSKKNVNKVGKVLDESPLRLIRNIAHAKRTKLSMTSVWRILLKESSKYTYRIQMMQEQTVDNKGQRTDFA
jgi:hypothetical protein